MTAEKTAAVSHKNGHDWCLLCGRKNPRSLKLEFHADDDGVKDKDPRDNTQPNDSGGSQRIMGFGELNVPVATWGDYMDNVGTYGLKRSPGRSYGFVIEYEKNPLK